jgi:NADPH-dependent curcumin reductase CurA
MSESTAEQVKEIPEKMQAVICHGPENYQLEEVPVPTPGRGEALVKVEATVFVPVTLSAITVRRSFGATRIVRRGRRLRSFLAMSLSESCSA